MEMSLVRRYLIKDKPEGDNFVIKGDKLHHIFNVCRHSVESKFEVISPETSYLVCVKEVDKHKAVCEILSKTKKNQAKKTICSPIYQHAKTLYLRICIGKMCGNLGLGQ